MGDVRASDWTHLRRRHGGHRRRVPIQGQKLHLVDFTVPMDVNDRADIPGLQARVGNVVREHDAIMSFQDPTSSARGGEARLPVLVDEPNGSHSLVPAVRGLRNAVHTVPPTISDVARELTSPFVP